MSDLEQRRARGFRAKAAFDEFVGPALEILRQDYLAALSRIAVDEPWEAGKLTKLAVAQRVINEVEQQFRTAIFDGEVAADDKSRADRIAALPEAKRKFLRMA